jgi:hypothetical protein
LAAIASQRGLLSSVTDFEYGFFQIEGHCIEQEFQLNLGHPE